MAQIESATPPQGSLSSKFNRAYSNDGHRRGGTSCPGRSLFDGKSTTRDEFVDLNCLLKES